MPNQDSNNTFNSQQNSDIQKRVQEAVERAHARAEGTPVQKTQEAAPKKVFRATEPQQTTAAQPQVTGAPAPQQVRRVYRTADTNNAENVTKPATAASNTQPKARLATESTAKKEAANKPATTAKKKRSKKKSLPAPIIIAATLLIIVAGLWIGLKAWSNRYFKVGTGISNNKYSVASEEELIAYLNHSALMEGDTIAVVGDYALDIQEKFNGYLELPLVSFDCSQGGITFVNGTCYLYGGYSSKADLSGISFADTKLYIDAPESTVTWNMAPADTSTINVKSLNGSDCQHDLGILTEGSYTTVPVTITNTSSSATQETDITLIGYNFAFADGDTITVPALNSGESTTQDVRLLCIEGGRGSVTGAVVDESGNTLLTASSDYVNVFGKGYYAGDTNTRTVASDVTREIQTRWSTLEQNVTQAYAEGLSFIISVEDNAQAQQLSQEKVDSLVGDSNSFVQVAGADTANDLGSIHLTLLNYPTNRILPSAEYGTEVDDMVWTAQSAINEAVDAGATVIYTQPTSSGDALEALYRLESMYNAAAIEVLQRTVEYPSQRWTVLYRAWDMINVYGRVKLFGVASSNNISANDIGLFYTKGQLGNLSSDGVIGMIESGNYFMTNGPELRFNVGGTQMGSEMTVTEGENVTLNLAVSDNVPLTSVIVYKFEITHKLEDLNPITVLNVDLTQESTTTYSTTITDTVTDDCYYRVEVVSKEANYSVLGEGRAYSNPVWVAVEGTTGNTSVDSITYESSLANNGLLKTLLGKLDNATLKQANNGDYYLDSSSGSVGLSGINVDTTASRVSINFHKGAGDKADFITIRVGAENGDYTTNKIYIVK